MVGACWHQRASFRPRPDGRQPRAWLDEPAGWRGAAELALQDLPLRDLTFVGADGFPFGVPATEGAPAPGGFRLRAARVPGARPEGPASLTFHTHDAGFTPQQNRVFVGEASEAEDGSALFRVKRVLGNCSLPANKLAAAFDLTFRKKRRLRPRLEAEAARRGQVVPRVHLPGEQSLNYPRGLDIRGRGPLETPAFA